MDPAFVIRGSQSLAVLKILRLLSRMVQGEMALAQAELSASLRGAVIGVALVLVALLLLLVGLNLLAAAAVNAVVVAGVPPLYAPLLVGGGTILIAAVLVWCGLSALNPRRLYPSRTAEQLRRDAQILKEIIADDPQA